MNGRKREGTVGIACGRRRLRHRKPTYKARAEVAGDAAWEVGGGHISEEGVDSKTRRSEGPLLEPGFRRRRDCVTAPKAQRTPFEKVRVLQRKLYRAAKAQPQRTFGVLYDKVCRLAVLGVAWDQVRRNRGAAGVDGETIEAIEARGALGFLLELREELISERYRPQAVRRVFIPKPDGRRRPLGIPTVEDRLVQRAVARIVEAVFEADFLDCSYGFRPRRSAHDALRTLRATLVTKRVRHLYEADIRGYFNHINHQWLKRMVAHRIADGVILRLIG